MWRLTGFLLLLVTACGPTAHVRYGEPTAGEAWPSRRTVQHETSAAFWRDPPSCVVVLPVASVTARNTVNTRAVEAAVARHLFGRVERVFGPRRRDHALRRLALDPEHPDDRRRFAELTDCDHGIRVMMEAQGGWAVVWAERQIGLTVQLVDLRDGSVLWRARHTARRGGGGVPLSPFSFLVSAGEAAALAADEDVPRSLLDDALRRVFTTLPDTR